MTEKHKVYTEEDGTSSDWAIEISDDDDQITEVDEGHHESGVVVCEGRRATPLQLESSFQGDLGDLGDFSDIETVSPTKGPLTTQRNPVVLVPASPEKAPAPKQAVLSPGTRRYMAIMAGVDARLQDANKLEVSRNAVLARIPTAPETVVAATPFTAAIPVPSEVKRGVKRTSDVMQHEEVENTPPSVPLTRAPGDGRIQKKPRPSPFGSSTDQSTSTPSKPPSVSGAPKHSLPATPAENPLSAKPVSTSSKPASKIRADPDATILHKINLSIEQQHVLRLAREGKSVFFTGSAGRFLCRLSVAPSFAD